MYFLLDDSTVICEHGQALGFEHFCEDLCPLSAIAITALKSNCSYIQNKNCPIYRVSNKICMDKVNVTISDYCTGNSYDYDEEKLFWSCPKANRGLDFEQCYNE